MINNFFIQNAPLCSTLRYLFEAYCQLLRSSFYEVLATDISLKNIPPGVYFLHYQTNGQSAHYHKLIVQ
ncbi:MAG: hypothetical protein C7N36_20625 [Bacteroidetes bacterium]|nr:MAG: hypothetical protein C7N36_20625 [Bacteroidota bacterium]